MDPITTSIVAALAAGVLKVAEKGVVGAHEGLERLIALKIAIVPGGPEPARSVISRS